MRTRLDICETCPSKVEVSITGQVLTMSLNLPENLFKCNECSCPLGAKTSAPKETCPLKKWGIAGTEDYY